MYKYIINPQVVRRYKKLLKENCFTSKASHYLQEVLQQDTGSPKYWWADYGTPYWFLELAMRSSTAYKTWAFYSPVKREFVPVKGRLIRVGNVIVESKDK